MPSFADSIFLFVLALLLFGPKRLPVLARELGKWMGEFRRASNEFKMQMEDELRASEQAERQKQIAVMEAAAPIPPPLEDPAPTVAAELPVASADGAIPPALSEEPSVSRESAERITAPAVASEPTLLPASEAPRPVPIATSGSLHMMPPATGLPTSRTRSNGALEGLIESIPEAGSATANEVAHAD